MKRKVRVTHIRHRDWDVVRLESDELQVDVVPAKGGDILQIKWLPLEMRLLWPSPWGLRARGALGASGNSYTRFIENYPGGWQTLFPNAGPATRMGGVEQSFHGEACLASWDAEVSDSGVDLSTRLVRSPFRLIKSITIEGSRVTVKETAENCGRECVQAIWSQHPAFGGGFLEGSCTLETAARTFITDAEAPSDLMPGQTSKWPFAVDKSGEDVDLRVVPKQGAGIARLGYLTDLERGWAGLANHTTGVRVDMEWDLEIFPHAWLWLEANATSGFPVYKEWYVVAIEPACAYPVEIDTAAGRSMQGLSFDPGQRRTSAVSITVGTA